MTYKPSGHRIAPEEAPRPTHAGVGTVDQAPMRPVHPARLFLWSIVVAAAVCAVAYGVWQGVVVGLRDDVNPVVAEFFGPDVTAEPEKYFGLDRVQVLTEPDPDLGPVLRVSYPQGSASQSFAREYASPEGGAQVLLRVDEPAEELHLRYFVRFPEGFDFVRGGKLPGLFGGTANDGRKIPDGSDGFSTRFMWRAQGAGEVYTYLPSSEEHGTSLGRGDWSFPTGRWVSIEQAVRLNEPDKADGSVTVWLNGAEVFHADDMVYRTVDDLKIDGVFFSTFFGGADPTWASPTDQVVDFADFEVSPTYIGSEGAG